MKIEQGKTYQTVGGKKAFVHLISACPYTSETLCHYVVEGELGSYRCRIDGVHPTQAKYSLREK